MVERRDGAKFNFNQGTPVVGGSKNLGLHVAHLLDQLVTNGVHFSSDLAAHLFAHSFESELSHFLTGFRGS